jgi:outer membrane protein assembly factor BamB
MLRTLLLLGSLTIVAQAGDIVGWRSDWTGKYVNAKPALEWAADKNVVWKTPMANWGNATPVIVGDRIFVCAEPATLICVNKKDGKIRWQKSYVSAAAKSAKPKTHRVNGYSSMTPVSDGTRVYVVSGYSTVACFDLNGKQLWLKTVNKQIHQWGTSASPVIAGGKLIVHINPKLTALDLKTGKQLWQTDCKCSWGTPLVVPIGGKDAIYTTGGDLVRASDGTVISKNPPLPWTCPVSDGKAIYVVDTKGAFALEIPKALVKGQKLKTLWQLPPNKARKDRYYASPIIHEGLIYATTRKGHFMAIDTATGKIVYENRLPLGGTTYPSIVLAGNHLLVSSDTGKTAIVKTGKEFKQVGINVFSKFRSTPIFDGDLMYVRCLDALYCVGKK